MSSQYSDSDSSNDHSLNRNNMFSLFPPEIKGEIFTWYCAERRNFVVQKIETGGHWKENDWKTYVQLQNPLVLGHVCKEWRDIVWFTSKFWDTLVVAVSVTSDNEEHPRLALIKEWLTRGAQFPLNLCIYIANVKHGTSVAELSNLYAELFKHGSRWSTAQIYIPGLRGSMWNDCLTTIQRRIDFGFHRLTTLRIITLGSPEEDVVAFQNHVSLLHRNVPNLKKLYITTGRHSVLTFPWNKLVAYGNDFVRDSPATIFRKTQRLQHCVLNLASLPYTPRNFEGNGDPPELSLPHLTSLKVLAHGTEQIVKAFNKIQTPALLHLDIQVNLIYAGELACLLRSMFTRLLLPHPLRTLKLSTGMFHFEDFVNLFEDIPALEELYLNLRGDDTSFVPGLNDRFLHMLRPFKQHEEQKALLTQLRLFHYRGPLSLSGKIFVDFVYTRWIYGGMDILARLEDVRLILSRNSFLTLGKKEEKKLRDLREEGMVIDLFGILGQFSLQLTKDD